jgi:RNA polymerase sigma-70 factor (ECF subfamily)
MTAPNPELEADCIRRILAGEKHLFHDLIRPCERSIYFLLYSLLKNEAEAEDVAQETVIKVYQNLDKFRGDSQFRTWVLSIARNEGLGRLRKISNRREDPEIYRNVVLLRDIEEMDIRESAAVLGITEASVKVRLHRARALLQRNLAPQLKGYAPMKRRWFGGRA